MKKFTSLLISCSLTLAGAALAQQPDEQASPKPNQAAEKGKGHAPEAKPEQKAPRPDQHQAPVAPKMEQAPVAKPTHENKVPEPHGAQHAPDMTKAPKADMTPKTDVAPKADMTPKAAAPDGAKKEAQTTTPAAKEHREGQHKNPAAAAAAARAAASPAATAAATPAAKVAATPAPTAPMAAATATPPPVASATPAASVAPSVGVAGEQNAKVNPAAIAPPKPNTPAVTKRPDQQKVQQIKTEHASFRAQARPDRVPAVTYNQNYRVEGSDRWQGRQYEAFRSYHPERHDESYYRSRYSRVELIGGGYYYLNAGYWYPAWGYNQSNEYYAYDGPIYVGHRSEPPDRVIADVQTTLQEMGYYKGEVDGLLGPLTRQALTGYQEDAGLQTTAAIDEPTLDSLNMSS